MSAYTRYRAWLAETGNTSQDVTFEQWLQGTYPDDTALQREQVVTSIVSGDLPKAGRNAEIMTEVSAGSDDDLRAGLAAMARTRMRRVSELTAYSDLVEQRLMQRINVNDASTDQLLAFSRYLRSSIRNDMEIILNTIRTTEKTGLEGAQFTQFNVMGDVSLGGPTDRPESRDKIRSTIEGLLKSVRKLDGNNPTTTAA